MVMVVVEVASRINGGRGSSSDSSEGIGDGSGRVEVAAKILVMVMIMVDAALRIGNDTDSSCCNRGEIRNFLIKSKISIILS